MPQYVCLMNFTTQGVQAVAESPKRAGAFRELAASMGITIRENLWTMGRYDVVVVLEAPDDETMTALALRLSKLGNMTTQTLRAFNVEEFSGVVEKMG